MIPLRPLLEDLGSRFAQAGHRLALVGGPVRDALLGRASLDLDCTTDARPEETVRLLRSWGDSYWEIGKEFGTIGARKGEQVVEVTTFRSDSYDSASRKPEVQFGDTLEGDLLRRDFTVNAMALELPALTFVDPYGGLVDLAAGRLRTPGAPEVSFGDDPLRMMRAARFAAQLGFRAVPEVIAAMSPVANVARSSVLRAAICVDRSAATWALPRASAWLVLSVAM
jgi:poly(A) polymerase